jgi:DNA-binding beta-propeller fold protein YncE
VKRLLVAIVTVLMVVSVSERGEAQPIDLSVAEAAEEFRWGVHAFHAGRFNDAIVAFTRTLALQSDDYRAREWLGRAYLRSGFEEAAIGEWEVIEEEGQAKAYLVSRIEHLRFRRGVLPLLEEDLDFSRSQRVSGLRNGTTLFRRPGGVAVEPHGDFFLVSLGTQEVLRISPNGRIRSRIRGGLEGLDRPFDVAWNDHSLYVTEFGRDRISVFDEGGSRTGTIGSPGLGTGQLLGPQYLVVSDGFVYVSEWGTRRVSKFTTDGDFVLTIGEPSSFFPGFSRPTGIAVDGDNVYVADVDDQGPALQLFDGSGNHLRRIELPLQEDDIPDNITGTVVEDISWYDRELLLITAGTGVLLFDPETESVVATLTDEERVRISSVARDANRRILVSDFDADDFALFEPEGSLYSGLDVRVERIVTRSYPRIGVLVSVHDRNGRPVVGLETENFILSENGRPMNDAEIELTGSRVTALDTIGIVQVRSGQRYIEDAARAVSDIAGNLPPQGLFSLYTAADQPVLVSERPAGPQLFADRLADTMVDQEGLFRRDEVALDRSIRLAGTRLLEGGLRRNVVLVGDAAVGDAAFAEHSLEELASFFVNNGIRFHLVLLEERSPDPELEFLVERTGGTSRYLYEPAGIAPLVENFTEDTMGRYWLTYRSEANPDFGRAYIAVSAEARIFVRSGRDEIGFFPPSEQ